MLNILIQLCLSFKQTLQEPRQGFLLLLSPLTACNGQTLPLLPAPLLFKHLDFV